MIEVDERIMVDQGLGYDSGGKLKTMEGVGDEVWFCLECRRLWTGNEQCHCSACHRHFSSNSSFDEHTVAPPPLGPRPFKTCKDAIELEESRLVLIEDRWGRVWAWPGAMAPEAIAARRAVAL